MNSELITRRQELINMIVFRSIQEGKCTFADYPVLNDELKVIDAQLYPDSDYLYNKEPWNVNDIVTDKITADDFNKHLEEK